MTLSLRYTIHPRQGQSAVWDNRTQWWATGPLGLVACHAWINTTERNAA